MLNVVGHGDPFRSVDRLGPKLFEKRLAAAREDRGIYSDSSKRGAQLNAAFRESGVGCQDSCRLLARQNAMDGALDSVLHIRVSRLAHVTETCGEIGGTDKHSVDSR